MLLIRWLNNLNNQNELTTPITVNPSENEVSTRESQVIAEQHTSLRISPLPPPEDFAKYKEIMPDLPERIVKQFEEDSITARELQKERQTAEIELQKSAQNADISFDKRSQWLAFALITAGIIGTIILAYLDKDTAASATALSTLALVFKGVFSKNSSDKKSENDR